MPREIEKAVATGGSSHIGGWLVEPSLNRISRGDTTIRIELKMMDVLVCLAERAGEEAHMLLGHSGPIADVAFDPRGRWIASSSGPEVRLWPMPDLSKPPLHTLPREELIAKLKTLTNLRVVRDEDFLTLPP